MLLRVYRVALGDAAAGDEPEDLRAHVGVEGGVLDVDGCLATGGHAWGVEGGAGDAGGLRGVRDRSGGGVGAADELLVRWSMRVVVLVEGDVSEVV